MARDDQIGDPVAASFRTGMHMVDFEWPVSSATVSAAMLPLGEQVLPLLGAEEGAALVGDAFERGILEQGRVEAHQFQGDGPSGTVATQPLHPRQHMLHSART